MKGLVIKLTVKEEEVMRHFWSKGELFVRELVTHYDDPKPHFNTLSTVVRGLEEKGFLSHHDYGSTYRYYAIISQEEFSKMSLHGVIGKYYDNSIFSAVSALVETKEISSDELRELLRMVENQEL